MKNNKKGTNAVRLIVISTAIVFIFWGVLYLHLYLSMGVNQIWEIKSDDHSYKGILAHHGILMGQNIYFIADPVSETKGDEVCIGRVDVGDGPTTFIEAVWSKDESVLAVKTSDVYPPADSGKYIKKEQYTHAYDFKGNKAFAMPLYESLHIEETISIQNIIPQEIENLLEQRGGEGRKLNFKALEPFSKRLYFGSPHLNSTIEKYMREENQIRFVD